MGPDDVRREDDQEDRAGRVPDDVTIPAVVETVETAYSASVLKKAQALIDDGVVTRAEGEEDVWEIPGSTGRLYVVRVVDAFDPDEPDADPNVLPWMSCTCPNGANRGGRPACYHTAAVALVLQEERGEKEDDDDEA